MNCNNYKFFLLESNTFRKNQNQIDKCKILNNKLWECIEKKRYISNCGKEYYYFIRCVDKIK